MAAAYILIMAASKWTSADLPSLAGRTFMVTGGNSGIGLVAARELGRAGGRVVLAVRDPARGEDAAATIPGGAEVRRLDLADLSSARAFAEAWKDDFDVLINNAGVMATPERRTKDGFELQIGTNHLGHFALTNLLLPHVTDRVVTISSFAHRTGRIRLDDLNWERSRYQRWPAYSQSKLANLLFTLELQRRLAEAGSSVLAVAAHPGWAATNLQGHTESRIQDALLAVFNRFWAQSEEMGALSTLYAATEDIPGGTYIGPDGWQGQRGHPTRAVRGGAAKDEETARALWDLSERLTKTGFPLTPAAA